MIIRIGRTGLIDCTQCRQGRSTPFTGNRPCSRRMDHVDNIFLTQSCWTLYRPAGWGADSLSARPSQAFLCQVAEPRPAGVFCDLCVWDLKHTVSHLTEPAISVYMPAEFNSHPLSRALQPFWMPFGVCSSWEPLGPFESPSGFDLHGK